MRGLDQGSSKTFRSRKSSWYLTMCPHIDACVMFGKKSVFLLKGLGRGWGGVRSWAGMGLINYGGIDCAFFSLVLCFNCAKLHVPCYN